MACIFVAYNTAPVAGALMPEFEAPSNYKDQAKISAYIKAKEDEFISTAKNQPYTGRIDTVAIHDSKSETVFWHKSTATKPAALAVQSWLYYRHPDVWASDLGCDNRTGVVFVGFRIRQFLKMLGIECSLPANSPKSKTESHALPLGVWYDNREVCDIEAAVMPSGFAITWPMVLEARGMTAKHSDWKGPCVDVRKDYLVGTELATQLGFVANVGKLEPRSAEKAEELGNLKA